MRIDLKTFTMEQFLDGDGCVLVIDVESMGLHGDPFAFGYVVWTKDGARAQGREACARDNAIGLDEDRTWVMKNIPEFPITCYDQHELRQKFWGVWDSWKRFGAIVAAECPWPVEANFLSACVADDLKARKFEGPYPLYDISSWLFAAGINPLQTQERLQEELPVHDPMRDAYQSARLMTQAFKKITGRV